MSRRRPRQSAAFPRGDGREIAKIYPDLTTNAHGIVSLIVPQTITACAPQQWQRAEVMRLDFDRGVFCGFLSRSPFFTTQEDVHKYLKECLEADLKSKVKNWICSPISEGKGLDPGAARESADAPAQGDGDGFRAVGRAKR